jgi:hypothetical protein
MASVIAPLSSAEGPVADSKGAIDNPYSLRPASVPRSLLFVAARISNAGSCTVESSLSCITFATVRILGQDQVRR